MQHFDQRAFVLLSGGLDSTTLLYEAMRMPMFNAGVEALSIDYGQRHSRELEAAANICKVNGIKHTRWNIGDVLAGASLLTDKNAAIPDVAYSEIEGKSPAYVPFRNGTMLALLTAHAEKWIKANDDALAPVKAGIFFGAHAEDADNWAYADCTPEFIGAMANAIFVGSYQNIRLHTPFMWMTKAQIVRRGLTIGVPFASTWSCYAGGDKHCGVCPTCYARKNAFEAAGVTDPTDYANAAARRS